MEWMDIISHQCGDEFVYQYPRKQFSRFTVVQVKVNQIAVFVRDGQVADVLKPGAHVLTPETIPILSGILKRLFQNQPSEFSAEIYFFSTSYIPNLKFGTSVRMNVCLSRGFISEEDECIPIRAGVYGTYHLKVEKPVLLLKSLLADRTVVEPEFIEHYFSSILISAVKVTVGTITFNEKISIFQVEQHLDRLSMVIQSAVAPAFDRIGLQLVDLEIADINPDMDPDYEKVKAVCVQKLVALQEADTIAKANRLLGVTYPERELLRILENHSKNTSSGQAVDAAMNLNMMRIMNDLFYREFGKMYHYGADEHREADSRKTKTEAEEENSFQQVCPMCKQLNPAEARYCMHCSSWLVNTKGGTGR